MRDARARKSYSEDQLPTSCRRADRPWEAWLEFHPTKIGQPILRTDQETSQPNRVALEYWADGLEPILSGRRTCAGPGTVAVVNSPISGRANRERQGAAIRGIVSG
jgi:hypothetical protein